MAERGDHAGDRTGDHTVELRMDPAAGLRAVARLAASWGAGWEADGDGSGGRLELPVLAGLRRGILVGRLRVWSAGGGSRVSFEVEDSRLRVETPTVAVLLLAACGALVTVLAPFFPALIPAVPLGVVLSLATWLFVVARLKNSGPEEFLETLAKEDVPES